MLTEQTTILKNILIVLSLILFGAILYFTHILSDGLVPILLSVFTAMLLQPFVNRLKKLKFNFLFASTIVYALFIFIFILILAFLSFSLNSMIDDIPKIFRELRDQILDTVILLSKNEFFKKYFYREDLMKLIMDTITQAISFKNFNDYILAPLTFTFDILKAFTLYSISLIFMIPAINDLPNRILTAFPDKNGPFINETMSNIMDQLQHYVVAKFIISFFTGFFSFFVLIFFKIKYPFIWSVILFLFNFVPYIGSIIAVSLPVLMSVLLFKNLIISLFLLVSLTTVQFIMGNLIEPHLMSKKLNLNPAVILISLLIWGYIWGVIGVILAVPIMSIISLVLYNIPVLRPISILMSNLNETDSEDKKDIQ